MSQFYSFVISALISSSWTSYLTCFPQLSLHCSASLVRMCHKINMHSQISLGQHVFCCGWFFLSLDTCFCRASHHQEKRSYRDPLLEEQVLEYASLLCFTLSCVLPLVRSPPFICFRGAEMPSGHFSNQISIPFIEKHPIDSLPDVMHARL